MQMPNMGFWPSSALMLSTICGTALGSPCTNTEANCQRKPCFITYSFPAAPFVSVYEEHQNPAGHTVHAMHDQCQML